MPSVYAPVALCLAAAALAALAGSCGPARQASEPRVPRDVDVPEYLRDTIGEVARFAGREPVAVQGYGFVTGLDGTGTRVVPPGIRQMILDMMRRNKVDHAEDILASPDTAVVTVGGWIRPGAGKGELFDLVVRTIPNTETTSLEGGFLLECDLTRVVMTQGVESRSEVLALGRGSIFVSPFAPEGKAKATTDPRAGGILAGGKTLKARHFRLALLTPSVRIADQIVRLVNARFPGAASGTEDAGQVDLEVPQDYLDDKIRFLDLVGALYMREMPGARDRRIDLLIEALKSGKDMDRAALCLEAFGPAVAPRLYVLADHPDEEVRFYAGRTLAALQNARAVHLLEGVVLKEGSPLQEQAVAALGQMRSGIGLGVLGRALNVEDARVRVAAWRAMDRLSSRTFLARAFADKFSLSMVASRGEPFVYIARTLKPQIAVFGDMKVRPPVLAETRRVIATAREGDGKITLISRRRSKDLRVESTLSVRDVVEKLAAPLGPADADAEAEIQGLDLGYSDVVGLLYEMSQKGALNGPIVLQPLEYAMWGARGVARPIVAENAEP